MMRFQRKEMQAVENIIHVNDAGLKDRELYFLPKRVTDITESPTALP